MNIPWRERLESNPRKRGWRWSTRESGSDFSLGFPLEINGRWVYLVEEREKGVEAATGKRNERRRERRREEKGKTWPDCAILVQPEFEIPVQPGTP
jgi:hypothetical protein